MAHQAASTPALLHDDARQGERSEPKPARRRDHRHTYGALDLGTNNCRLLIARPNDSGFTVIDAFSRIVRLGEGLSRSNALSQDAMDRAVGALSVCCRSHTLRLSNRVAGWHRRSAALLIRIETVSTSCDFAFWCANAARTQKTRSRDQELLSVTGSQVEYAKCADLHR